ncbi:MAG: septum formation protein Maf [Chloroflexi bacterium]|nr:septum formation protein Maf [Chloroflexota bacterium]
MGGCSARRTRNEQLLRPRGVRLIVDRPVARIVLASASPRRRALIELLRLPWRAAAANLDEQRYLLSEPMTSALNVALGKAQAAQLGADEIALAADTLVVCDGEVLGKPDDATEAEAMLRSLRDRAHSVLSGIVLRGGDGREWGGVVDTRVWMRAYSESEVHTYVARGEPFDKAGGYAIQDAEFRPVQRVDGCYLNVVGLPVCAVAAGLDALGVPVERPASLRAPCEYCRQGARLVEIG